MSLYLHGLGHFHPEVEITNRFLEDLDIGTTDAWILERVGIPEKAENLPATLSGGQRQRVAVARALANDPPILAADEPTGNLDSATAEIIFQLFNQLVDQGKTILMVTHDPDKAQRVTRVVTIADGEIQKKTEKQRLKIEDYTQAPVFNL